MTDDEYDQWQATLKIRGEEAWLPPGREYRWKVRESGEGFRKHDEDEEAA